MSTFAIGSLFDTAPDLDTGIDLAPVLEASLERVTKIRFMPAAPPPKKTLRDQLSDVDAIANTIEALDAEDLTDEARSELAAMLMDAIAGTKRKIDNATSALAMFEHWETAATAEATRLQLRAKRFFRRRERLEGYLVATLEASNLTKIEGETSAIALRLNPAKVVIDDATKISHEFLRYPEPPPPEPDKTAIKAALKAKRTVPGAHLERGKKLVRS